MPTATLAHPLTPIHEACALFADGLEHQAQRRLQGMIADETQSALRESWRTLLDLYRLTGNKEQFDATAAEYVGRFAAPSPAWDPLVDENQLLPDLRIRGEAFVQLIGDLDATAAIALNAQDALCRHAVVRIDGSRLLSLDKQACSVLLGTIARLLDYGGGVHLTGMTRWVECIQRLIERDLTFRPAWELLLALWRLKGDEREFIRVGLEFALGFGVQPPEWEPIVAPMVAVPSVEEKREEPRYRMGPEVMRLCGTVCGAQSFYLMELQNFALDRKYVNVDLSLLRRLDMAAAQALVNHVNGLIQEGKVVRLLRQHDLISHLLEKLEINAAVVCSPLAR